MRLSLLLCLLPLLSGAHALTPQFSKISNSLAASKQSELENSSAPLSQIVTFPNRVKMTRLSQAKPAEASKIEALLKSEGVSLDNLDTGDDFQTQQLANHGLFVAQFTSKPSRKMSATQVKTPSTGSFQLELTEGPVFKIVDQDATDGSALIQMPAATLNTWLKLSQNWGQNSSLEIEDPFYYLKDTVGAQKQNGIGDQRSFRIGLRPLPVPEEWQSPYGKDFVFNFTTRDASSFQMIWVRNNEKPARPPFGIKEIGPEGGTVELPGVGKIEIPAGALSEKQIISLKQVMNAPVALSEFSFPGGGDRIEQDYVSSVLEVQPKGLRFNKDFYPKITLNVNLERLGNNTPAVLSYVFSDDISYVGGGWRRLPRLMPIPSTSEELLSHPSLLKETGFFARVMDKEIPPQAGIYTVSN
jgi:hypothetical protein